MRKLLNKPWFVAVMAIAAIACVASAVFSNGQKFGLPGFTTPESPVADPVAEMDSSNATAWAVVNKISFPDSGRDPFAISVKVSEVLEKVPEPDLVDSVHLSAIWTQNGHTFVLVNDHIYQGGDEIGRIKIESATPEGVWLSHWKGRNFVSIGGNFTLNTPAAKSARVAGSL